MGATQMSLRPNTVYRRLRLLGVAATAITLLSMEGAMAQQWNELAPPTGKEALSRTYPAPFRSDGVDVRVRGGGGEVDYMMKMQPGETGSYAWGVRYIDKP